MLPIKKINVLLTFCEGNPMATIGSPHKGFVTRKASWLHDQHTFLFVYQFDCMDGLAVDASQCIFRQASRNLTHWEHWLEYIGEQHPSGPNSIVTHWGWVKYIYASANWVIFRSDSVCRRRAITWSNADLLSIELQGNLNRNTMIFAQENAFENVICKIAAILYWITKSEWNNFSVCFS